MSDLVKRLRRAKGSELMPKILLGHKNAEVACLEAADRIEELEREVGRWRQGSIDTWGAMNAMRNAINEHVAMPSIEGDLLKGPDNSIFCATVADAVIGAVLSLRSKLAAERALADSLYIQLERAWIQNMPSESTEPCGLIAYRKARGM